MNYFIEHLSKYFGLFYIPFLGVLISDFFIIFIKNRNKKTFYRTRLFFGTIFVISLTILVLFLKLQFSGNLNEKNIIQYGLNDINLGFFIIFFATLLIENFKLNVIWLILGFIIFICLFFLIGKEVIRCIKYFQLRNKKIKALKLQKAIIDKKIAIKEELENEEYKKYEKQHLALDLTIKEKVDEAFKNKSLPIFEDEKNEEGEEL
ncbi:MAG: hypothetical protein WCR79_05815 [Fusobacterium sp.]